MLLLSGCSRTKGNTTQNTSVPEKPVAAEKADDTPQAVEEPKESTPEAVLTRTPKHERKEDKPKEDKKEEAADDGKKVQVEENGHYYDVASVVLYYNIYGKLPSNYITKNEAKKLGWEGGAIEPYKKDAAIGGDHYGNYENVLPGGKKAKYIECDIDTHKKKRGAKRLVISEDRKYFYTVDHYNSFRELVVIDGEVISADGTRL
ncbi:MAG: ribonuclease [Lachnospiraceae bacterium]|nr:ribonuclease [Lachnospiraceae bacterium]